MSDEPDTFPWTDAAAWTASGEHQEPDDDDPVVIPWDVPGRVITLSARLGDGRTAEWSMLSGWSGDPDVVNAAQAVAALYSELGEMTAAARGLLGVSVDGSVNEPTWIAAGL
ncbi:hypothetical protein [Mycobacterium sp. NAZ190054]|uniref:hypothetical protein n=1 Tax=Mycobacterium sp. NAZ190054 TaxID=1747766 RepID=UPI0007916C29|nr:hypothetical protein [Mycobacterium sp. NAZ190054]KWX56878.1 hypothetical protein ASJ79_13095 [Mycobacterium sp. NAZ190054]